MICIILKWKCCWKIALFLNETTVIYLPQVKSFSWLIKLQNNFIFIYVALLASGIILKFNRVLSTLISWPWGLYNSHNFGTREEKGGHLEIPLRATKLFTSKQASENFSIHRKTKKTRRSFPSHFQCKFESRKRKKSGSRRLTESSWQGIRLSTFILI